MKGKKIIPVVLSLMFVFGFYGIAFGGEEPGGCSNLPPANSGPYLYGEFTVGLDQGDFLGCDVCPHYNLHLRLWKGQARGNPNQEHLFSWAIATEDKNICDYSPDELISLFSALPCQMEVEQPFKMSGVPVIADLTINRSCDRDLGMFSGSILIRVVR